MNRIEYRICAEFFEKQSRDLLYRHTFCFILKA